MRVRFDDDEMNLTPEMSLALGYQPADQPRSRRTLRAHHAVARPAPTEEDTSGLLVFLAAMTIAVLIWLATAQTPHHQATTQPSQPQASQQFVREVGNKKEFPDDIPAKAVDSPAGVSDPTPQAPARRDDVQPAQGIQRATSDIGNNEAAENPNIQVNQRNDTPQHLPADYDIGGTTSPTFLARQMPRGGAVDFLGYIPAGICLLYERANENGWRRVVSFDGRYAGYAQVYPTVAYQPRPMQPGFLEAIEMIRRIP